MSQHTSGPWSRKYGNYVYQGDAPSNCGRLIAICEPTSKTQEDWDETFANARLVAAAPDLFEALDKLLAATVDEDLKYGITLSEDAEEARAMALAAIAKTVGD